MSNKRVTLTYTVDLDHLEAEVMRLYNRTLDALAVSLSRASDPPSEMLSLATVERFDEVRKMLASVDYMLADIGKIIGGYVSYQVEESTANAPDASSEPNPAALVEQLKTLQKMMSQNDIPLEEQNIPSPSDR